MDKQYLFRNKLLILRAFRLGRIPPALYSSQILEENGFPVLVIEYGNSSEKRRIVPAPLPRRRFSNRAASFLPGGINTLWGNFALLVKLFFGFIREGRPRLIIAEGLHEQTVAYYLHCLLGVSYAVHVHEIYNRRDLQGVNRLFLNIEAAALRNAEFLIFPEKTRAKIYVHRYELTNSIFIVPNSPRFRQKGQGLDLREKLNLPPDSFLMAYIGGIGSEHAITEGVEALVKLSNVYFLIWGWGDKTYLESLKFLAGKLGVSERLKFLGMLDTDKWEHLEGCDISFCIYMPMLLRMKFNATASNKLLEAFACGIPVLTSAEDDFREIVEKYDVGVCASGFSCDAIVQALKTFMADDLGRKRKALNARKLHEDIFNYEAQFSEIIKKCSEYGFFPPTKIVESTVISPVEKNAKIC